MISFQEALQREELRREYCTDFLLRFPSMYVTDIVYWDGKQETLDSIVKHYPTTALEEYHKDAKRFQEKIDTIPEMVASLLHTPQLWGKQFSPPIMVFPKAWDLLEEEVTSILVHHEYVHARDVYHGIPVDETMVITMENANLLQEKTLFAMSEMRAYQHQVRNFSCDLRREFLRKCVWSLATRWDHLRQTISQNSFEREVIDRFLIEFDK